MAERYQDRPFPADDRYGRGNQAAPTQAETDPLAELARLIGQTDPFASQSRAPAPQPAPPADPYSIPTQPAYEDDAPPMPAWLKNRGRDTAFRHDSPQAEPHYDPQPDPYYAAPPTSHRQEPGFAAATTQPTDLGRYDDALYGQIEPSRDYIDPSQETAGYPDPQAYGYDGYDEPEQPKRRGGMMTIVAVLALAVVGTGGAFAYRTFMAAPRSSEPPIIKADPSPTKVVPPSAADASKPIQDRLASGNGAEALISREEQPQDPSKYGSRVVLPPLAQNANPPTPSSVAPANKPLAGPPPSGDEPRRIKTLAVRPDQADAAATPANRPAQRPATPPAATRSPPPPVANANASTANAPLSLSPQAAEPRTRMAATAPSAQPASSGGYLVQVSSQRNESDAQASYRALQGKFPSVLGSRAPLIKRADLGGKGVYYRAMVGPFGSPEEASQFCGNLKSAGGQCVVQRN
uniref:Sporulation domain protein n=1 Tax=Rhodopseudomonas palustris (strain BisA53) TaxID=316055 RepID=Q07N55_RHOP5